MANQRMQAQQSHASKQKSVERDLASQPLIATAFERPLALASSGSDAGSPVSPWNIWDLQRTIGNKAVCGLLGSSASPGDSLGVMSDYQADEFMNRVRYTTPASISMPAGDGKPTTYGGPPAGENEVDTAAEPEERRETAGSKSGERSNGAWSKQGDSRNSGARSKWGSAAGDHQPRSVSWGAIQAMGESGEGSATSGPPVASTLKTIQTHAGNKTTHGWTYFPKGFKAPNFTFESFDISTFGILPALGASPAWYSRPKFKQKANEGRGDSFFPTAGKHKTQLKEGGKTVYWSFSGAISTRIKSAEQEHCDDHAFAYQISLKEAEDILTNHIVGKMFGPKPTKAAAEQMVLDRITAKLTHPGLTNDKTKWKGKYDMLFRKTGTRDTNGWHNLPTANRTVVGSAIVYDIVAGTSKIGVVPSKDVIKY